MDDKVSRRRRALVGEATEQPQVRFASEKDAIAFLADDLERRDEEERNHLKISSGENDPILPRTIRLEACVKRPLMSAPMILPLPPPPPGQILSQARRILTEDQKENKKDSPWRKKVRHGDFEE